MVEERGRREEESRYLLREVDELADGVEGIGVVALLRAVALQERLNERRVPDFLFCHKLKEVALLGVDACLVELVVGELREAIVEQVEFDPLLVERQVQRLEVEVAVIDVLYDLIRKKLREVERELTWGISLSPRPPSGPGGGSTY